MLLIGLLITAGSVLLHFQKGMDFFLQTFFFRDGVWLVASDRTPLHFFLYTIPRLVPWIAAAAVLVRGAILRRAGRSLAGVYRALVFLAIFPVSVNFLKAVTGQPCPNAFSPFAGSLPADLLYSPGARCFPGGHASAGFALLGICFLIEDETRRKIFHAAIVAWGFTLGFYQVARGVHFFSDAVATFGLAYAFYGALRPPSLSAEAMRSGSVS